jgi:hypothetical protein
MPVPQASEDLYATLQRYQLLLLSAGRRLWSTMTPDFDTSWQRIAPRLTVFTAGAQFAAATAAVGYVPAALEETGQPDNPEATVRPQAFAGVASDGRSLEGLLQGAVAASKRAVGRGLGPTEALLGGRTWLEQALQSAVADAARDATAASLVTRPGMGWVRMVNPPCCSRCAVLAGKWYRWSDGFLRHPRCDCVHIPARENRADDFVTDPEALVRRRLVTDLSQDQRKRLDGGADLVKVLNESRDRWRVRMAADRRKQGPVDRLGRRRPTGWAGGTNPPPPGTTIHQLMDRLTSRVETLQAMRQLGIAE